MSAVERTADAPVTTARHGHVTLIELNRPEAMNAINDPLREALRGALEAVARDPETRAVVLTGAGTAFCGGADLKSAAANRDTSPRRTSRRLLHDFQPLLECITRMDKPVVAAVNGGAAGIGMSFALACDLMVMGRSGYLMSPFINLGLIPDGGAAWFLNQRIGYVRTFEMLAEGQKLDAERCLALGIANRVVEPGRLREAALSWAAELAGRPPIAMALTKRIARVSLATSLADVMAVEAELQAICVATEDSREAIAAFTEKRAPRFGGR